MSYTTLMHLWPGGFFEYGETFHNAWGSGPFVWDALAKKWLGAKRFDYDRHTESLWPLASHPGLPEHHRAVLIMTFDCAYVVKADYARAARDIRRFIADFPDDGKVANHWPRLGEIFVSNRDVPALGVHCTSVGENPFQGPWNEEKEDYDPVNWGDCFSVYTMIDGPKEQTCG